MNTVLTAKRFGALAALAVASTFVLSACAANEEAPADNGGASNSASALSGDFAGSGSSAQKAAQEAWIASFQTANPDVTITYDPAGSGAGRANFISGAVQFAGSDSYLSDKELQGTFAACTPDTDVFEVPDYISPIAVVFNVDGVDDLNLDAATIAGIFKGTITKWNDKAIAALNPDADLPDATITSVHRSDDSGTTKNFTDYLHQTAPDVWDADAADTFPYDAGDGAQGTAGVIDAVTNGTNTIGYADFSAAGDLSIASVKVGDEFVAPSADGAAAVVEESDPVAGRTDSDLAIAINRTTTDPSHYPLVLVSYLIGCDSYADAKAGAFVKAYAQYITSADGQSTAASAAGSAPLSDVLAGKVATVLDGIK
ncbi:phosphate ABC transporter substrate-binding protein PstS [Galbitalea sp. SE-J8]|uniref:phosphate ABC transporter substrate-binding protein PstS n=1 Tax=Galbitalea sp. SE-J8 TaxID=3054952 RepID=UPI00259C72DC|nr:phosphate ABC transporter substrate-binding protein PstS [Galbitalea sp. SE-J8]MDM4763777.1 phosphate ABC transporter substrate-binding protein PstS [Galbitalea sp. SE-J8]